MTFVITNPAGNTLPLTGLSFTDNLPTTPGTMKVFSTPGTTNNCGGAVTATAGTAVISLSGGSVAVNSTCTITVKVTVSVAGTYSNSVTINSTNGGLGNTSTKTVTAT